MVFGFFKEIWKVLKAIKVMQEDKKEIREIRDKLELMESMGCDPYPGNPPIEVCRDPGDQPTGYPRRD